MYEVHFCGSSEATYGLYNYKATGSLSQVIEGARIKSMQVPLLKYKDWIVLFKQNDEIVATRSINTERII